MWMQLIWNLLCCQTLCQELIYVHHSNILSPTLLGHPLRSIQVSSPPNVHVFNHSTTRWPQKNWEMHGNGRGILMSPIICSAWGCRETYVSGVSVIISVTCSWEMIMIHYLTTGLAIVCTPPEWASRGKREGTDKRSINHPSSRLISLSAPIK